MLQYIYFQSIGPVIIDRTPPVFVGSHIAVHGDNNFLIADWSQNAFIDREDPYPLTYEYAIGNYYIICLVYNINEKKEEKYVTIAKKAKHFNSP